MSEPENASAVLRRLKALFRRFDVDRAVFYALAVRVWQLLAGAVTVGVIAVFFTRELQGYYFVFWDLIALQTFVELGLHIVVINVASHEWAHLRLDEDGSIVGDEAALSRLVSLGRLIFAWYGVATALFMTAVATGGYWFFSQRQDTGIDWLGPWLCVVVSSGLMLWTLPFNALLQGCNQVATVNRYRLIQAAGGNVAIWAAIVSGLGLWAAALGSATRLCCELYLLLGHYRRFFRPFWRAPRLERVDWRTEIWPLQWRLAVGGIFGYFGLHLFTPVLFHYHGPTTAGQMGMTWRVLTALQAAALAWVTTRAPQFGILVSRRQFDELDRRFRRTVVLSLGVLILGGAAFLLFVTVLNLMDSWLADRVLGPLATLVFLLAVIAYHIPHCQAVYIRAHKRELLMLSSIGTGCGTGLLVWWWGRTQLAALGAGLGFLAVVALFTLPYDTLLWLRCRRER